MSNNDLEQPTSPGYNGIVEWHHQTVKAIAKRGGITPINATFWCNIASKVPQREETVPQRSIFIYVWRHLKNKFLEVNEELPPRIQIVEEVWVKLSVEERSSDEDPITEQLNCWNAMACFGSKANDTYKQWGFGGWTCRREKWDFINTKITRRVQCTNLDARLHHVKWS